MYTVKHEHETFWRFPPDILRHSLYLFHDYKLSVGKKLVIQL